jgi:hypothetical protein
MSVEENPAVARFRRSGPDSLGVEVALKIFVRALRGSTDLAWPASTHAPLSRSMTRQSAHTLP